MIAEKPSAVCYNCLSLLSDVSGEVFRLDLRWVELTDFVEKCLGQQLRAFKGL